MCLERALSTTQARYNIDWTEALECNTSDIMTEQKHSNITPDILRLYIDWTEALEYKTGRTSIETKH